jgi:CDGSH-type Zn-finger protein
MTMYSNKAPYPVEVQANETIYICQCGHTKNPPYCDGTHNQYPDVQPFPFHSHDESLIHVCGCGRSDNMPFCDGSHSKV